MGVREPRAVTGIVLIDKPAGATSNRVLQRTKRLFAAAKAGHTGSLDPGATGMLPVCFGAATKVSALLLDASKTYRVDARLGAATDTGDADGRVIERRERPPPDAPCLGAAVESMRGASEQVPPMYSALKVGGRRLYELAREGREVPRLPRRIVVHEIELERFDWPDFRIRVHCSKGTYVRTLVGDIAGRLDEVAHVTALRRLAVAPYAESGMVPLDVLEAEAEAEAERGWDALDRHLLGVDSALVALPAAAVGAADAVRLGHGQRVICPPDAAPGRVRVYGPGGCFLGVGEVDAERGELRPKRWFAA